MFELWPLLQKILQVPSLPHTAASSKVACPRPTAPASQSVSPAVRQFRYVIERCARLHNNRRPLLLWLSLRFWRCNNLPRGCHFRRHNNCVGCQHHRCVGAARRVRPLLLPGYPDPGRRRQRPHGDSMQRLLRRNRIRRPPWWWQQHQQQPQRLIVLLLVVVVVGVHQPSPDPPHGVVPWLCGRVFLFW